MYRVVFSGEIASGFESALVFQAAKQRMKASPAQMDKVFSGRKVVLKKGMTDKEGAYYLAELQKIGMRVLLEREPEAVAPKQAAIIPEQKEVNTAKAFRDSSFTVSSIRSTVSSSEDDWAIASIHEPMQDLARMEATQPGFEDTAINHPPFRHTSSADPVLREPFSPNPAAAPAPVPAHIDFDSLARHLASPGKSAAIVATDAHARLDREAPASHVDFNCPHCGKSIQLPTSAQSTQLPNPALAIRPADRLHVSRVEHPERPSGSFARLAAKITSILPGR